MENMVNIYIACVLNMKDYSKNQDFNVLKVTFFPILFFIASHICQYEKVSLLNWYGFFHFVHLTVSSHAWMIQICKKLSGRKDQIDAHVHI